MPRVRRRRTATREGFDAERTRYRLLEGHDFLLFDGAELSDEELAEAWQELRDELLPDFIAEHPGERPYAWWRWDAPEYPRVTGDADPIDALTFFWWSDCGIEAVTSCYETVADYLDRLDLLTDSERAALAATNEGAIQ